MQLTIALDMPSKQENLALVQSLKEYDDIWIKVGLRSYIRDGKEFISTIKTVAPKCKIFLDLKLYDIPNTMADTAMEIAKLDIDMFNIHASAGEKAMREVMSRLSALPSRPLVLAVTALTSFEKPDFENIYGESIEKRANEFAIAAHKSGLDGVVCSVHESKAIKRVTNDKFLTLCPGIRPFGEDSSDQSRVATLELANSNDVDFPVIGRPIYKDPNPVKKIEQIMQLIKTLN